MCCPLVLVARHPMLTVTNKHLSRVTMRQLFVFPTLRPGILGACAQDGTTSRRRPDGAGIQSDVALTMVELGLNTGLARTALTSRTAWTTPDTQCVPVHLRPEMVNSADLVPAARGPRAAMNTAYGIFEMSTIRRNAL